MPLHLERLTGTQLVSALSKVARLRIEVFRDWPYLYDGDLEYENAYLQSYRNNPHAVVVGAYDGASLVGASTGIPLSEHADDFSAAFEGGRVDPSEVFYCAESVLLPAFRGQGIGHGFFDVREEWARACGFRVSAFCSVLRPSDHPMRPNDYLPLDEFWRRRGYRPLDGAIAEFAWKDLGEERVDNKSLQFWTRDLTC